MTNLHRVGPHLMVWFCKYWTLQNLRPREGVTRVVSMEVRSCSGLALLPGCLEVNNLADEPFSYAYFASQWAGNNRVSSLDRHFYVHELKYQHLFLHYFSHVLDSIKTLADIQMHELIEEMISPRDRNPGIIVHKIVGNILSPIVIFKICDSFYFT